MNTLTIGLLLPSSTIIPLNKDFEKGLKDGLKQTADTLEIDIVKEFIGNGDVGMMEKALNKLFSFDDAHLITGIVSNKAAGELSDKFKKQQKPFLINNLGGHIPEVAKLNEYIFINSPHLWQHAYAMGQWGVKTFGKKGMFLGAVYDAGYSFSQMFYDGMLAADATVEWSFSVPPMPGPGQLTDMSILFPYLEQYQPDFVFAAFCGTETTFFLNEMIKHGWHKKTKIIGLPYLLEPFEPLLDDVTVYTTSAFNYDEDITPEKTFYHLGRQTAQIIIKAAAASNGNDLAEQIAKLSNTFNTGYPDIASDKISILQHDIIAHQTKFTSKLVAQENAFGLEKEKLRPLTAEVSASWFNPYLCI